MLESPMRQSPMQGYQTKRDHRGSPIRRQNRQTRKKRENTFPRLPFSAPEQVIDVDFHEDFPPLPKSVKPTQSPTLKKIAQASVTVKDDLRLPDPAINTDSEATVVVSRSSSPNMAQGAATPMHFSHNNTETDGDHSHRSSVQGTPAFPRAPPPSSCELSTAGNTAPSTPTATHVRPRITAQSLHDRLIHANATLATLQEGRPLAMATRSAPASPFLGPTIVFGDLGRRWIGEGGEEVMDSLDTTMGTAIAVEENAAEQWTSASLVSHA